MARGEKTGAVGTGAGAGAVSKSALRRAANAAIFLVLLVISPSPAVPLCSGGVGVVRLLRLLRVRMLCWRWVRAGVRVRLGVEWNVRRFSFSCSSRILRDLGL
jgi:hypothetical protein